MNIVNQVIGLIVGWPDRLFQGFQYSHFCSGSSAERIRYTLPTAVDIFLFLLLMVRELQVIHNCFLEVSVDDILSQVFILMHTHIHIYIHIYSHTHTPHTCIHNVLTAVYYSCHLMISSYQKSYQQYFDILLNYKNLEIYCYKMKKIIPTNFRQQLDLLA